MLRDLDGKYTYFCLKTHKNNNTNRNKFALCCVLSQRVPRSNNNIIKQQLKQYQQCKYIHTTTTQTLWKRSTITTNNIIQNNILFSKNKSLLNPTFFQYQQNDSVQTKAEKESKEVCFMLDNT